MSKLFKRIGIALVIFIMPALALAQGVIPGNSNANTIFDTVSNFVSKLVPFLITVGIVYLIYGIISFMTAKDEEKKKAGKNTMIYGIIGLFVIVSVWGLVSILQRTFGVSSGGIQQTSLPVIQ